jgi:hypothetical protein
MMNKLLQHALLLALSISLIPVKAAAKEGLHFMENKGQVTDQFGNSRQDIDFKLSAAKGLSVFLGKGSIHYQWTKNEPASSAHSVSGDNQGLVPVTMYRMDVSLVGANPDPVFTREDEQAYFERYYLPATGANGARARAFGRVTYHNVYPGIDWVFYFNPEGRLEHDFIIHPGAKATDIRIRYAGALSLLVNQDGSLSAGTPLGIVVESAPHCYEAKSRKKIDAKFVVDGDYLSIQTEAYEGTLVIDPAIEWSTYYGGSHYDVISDVVSGKKNNKIYAVGATNSTANIATTGSHQASFGGGNFTAGSDAFVTCFNNLGESQWATYYGGSGRDLGRSISCDTAGNIYFSGFTTSTSAISTPGSHQPVYAGDPALVNSQDVFLVKLDQDGQRIWGTYLGGPEGEGVEYTVDHWAINVHCDRADNVYVTTNTASTTGIATTGAFQSSLAGSADIFLAKFKTSGQLSWCTYYGGTGADFSSGIATDSIGNIFIVGHTNSMTNFATPGTHQANYGGNSLDAFLAKFDTAGQRLWCTYYGGQGPDFGYAVACDDSSNVYLTGFTQSTSGIATAGSFKNTIGGITDGFLAKFSNSGVISWATYYGGALNTDVVTDLCFARNGSLYIAGITSSTDGIATPDAINPYINGLNDSYIARFEPDGNRVWGSYFGGNSGLDYATGIASDTMDNLYLVGHTNSPNGFTSPGSYQPLFGGYTDGFIIKINDCASPVPGAITGPAELCAGSTQQYSTGLLNNIMGYIWTLPSGWSGSSTTNSISVTAGATGGIISVATWNYCGPGDTISINVAVQPVPNPVISRTGNVLNTTQPFATYQWNLNGAAIPAATNPTCVVTVNGAYSVTVTNGIDCEGTSEILNISNITGIDELLVHNGIKIYPNPANEMITVELPAAAKMQLWDMTGRLIKSAELKTGMNRVDIAAVTEGIYLVKILSPEGMSMGSMTLVKKGD